jgi:hypothetical protein
VCLFHYGSKGVLTFVFEGTFIFVSTIFRPHLKIKKILPASAPPPPPPPPLLLLLLLLLLLHFKMVYVSEGINGR